MEELDSDAPRGTQVWRIDPGPGVDAEVSLAAHPTEAGAILLAWHEGIQRVWSARTRDAGASWIVEQTRDPALDDPVQGRTAQESFDATAAFGPDGTHYVLFGGHASPVPGSAVVGGMTLARLGAGGWSFHHVDERGTAWVWDAMHLAVSPGSGRLHAVAQSISTRTIGYYTSDDRGTTWSSVRAPLVVGGGPTPGPGPVEDVARDRYWFLPRVAAGPGGQVAIAVKAQAGSAPRVAVSSDDGGAFGRAEIPDTASAGIDTGLPLVAGAPLRYVFASQDGIRTLARGEDGTWAEAIRTAPDWGSATPAWTASARAPDGSVWTLLATESSAASRVQVRAPSGEGLYSVEYPSPRPYSPGAGDEYGGIAFAADGALWAAWAEPGGTGAIVVARFPPTINAA